MMEDTRTDPQYDRIGSCPVCGEPTREDEDYYCKCEEPEE